MKDSKNTHHGLKDGNIMLVGVAYNVLWPMSDASAPSSCQYCSLPVWSELTAVLAFAIIYAVIVELLR